MAVLILAHAHDEHAVMVGAAIEALGERHEVLDLSHFPERAALTMRYDCCGGGHHHQMRLDDRVLDLSEFGSVWWRRPQLPVVSDDISRPSHRQFAANESMEALAGLWYALDARWVNDPDRDDVAHRKAYQLRVAQQIGLPIPSTVMTNDPDEALRFLDSRAYRDVIFKPFSATDAEWRETRLVTDVELDHLEQVRHAPVIFQEYVPAIYDLRITVIGDHVFPAAIWSQETDYVVDSRIDIGNAKIEAVDLPPDVEDRLRELMHRLDLTFGAIDMRLQPDGQHTFLEINPAGQFAYIEAATGQPLAEAMARVLVERQTAST